MFNCDKNSKNKENLNTECHHCKVVKIKNSGNEEDDINSITEAELDIIENIKNRNDIYIQADRDHLKQKSLFLQKLEADFIFLRKVIDQKYTETKEKIENSFRVPNHYLTGYKNIQERIDDLMRCQPKTDSDFFKRREYLLDLCETVDVYMADTFEEAGTEFDLSQSFLDNKPILDLAGNKHFPYDS